MFLIQKTEMKEKEIFKTHRWGTEGVENISKCVRCGAERQRRANIQVGSGRWDSYLKVDGVWVLRGKIECAEKP